MSGFMAMTYRNQLSNEVVVSCPCNIQVDESIQNLGPIKSCVCESWKAAPTSNIKVSISFRMSWSERTFPSSEALSSKSRSGNRFPVFVCSEKNLIAFALHCFNYVSSRTNSCFLVVDFNISFFLQNFSSIVYHLKWGSDKLKQFYALMTHNIDRLLQ
jgi:hypothetical protein